MAISSVQLRCTLCSDPTPKKQTPQGGQQQIGVWFLPEADKTASFQLIVPNDELCFVDRPAHAVIECCVRHAHDANNNNNDGREGVEECTVPFLFGGMEITSNARNIEVYATTEDDENSSSSSSSNNKQQSKKEVYWQTCRGIRLDASIDDSTSNTNAVEKEWYKTIILSTNNNGKPCTLLRLNLKMLSLRPPAANTHLHIKSCKLKGRLPDTDSPNASTSCGDASATIPNDTAYSGLGSAGYAPILTEQQQPISSLIQGPVQPPTPPTSNHKLLTNHLQKLQQQQHWSAPGFFPTGTSTLTTKSTLVPSSPSAPRGTISNVQPKDEANGLSSFPPNKNTNAVDFARECATPQHQLQPSSPTSPQSSPSISLGNLANENVASQRSVSYINTSHNNPLNQAHDNNASIDDTASSFQEAASLPHILETLLSRTEARLALTIQNAVQQSNDEIRAQQKVFMQRILGMEAQLENITNTLSRLQLDNREEEERSKVLKQLCMVIEEDIKRERSVLVQDISQSMLLREERMKQSLHEQLQKVEENEISASQKIEHADIDDGGKANDDIMKGCHGIGSNQTSPEKTNVFNSTTDLEKDERDALLSQYDASEDYHRNDANDAAQVRSEPQMKEIKVVAQKIEHVDSDDGKANDIGKGCHGGGSNRTSPEKTNVFSTADLREDENEAFYPQYAVSEDCHRNDATDAAHQASRGESPNASSSSSLLAETKEQNKQLSTRKKTVMSTGKAISWNVDDKNDDDELHDETLQYYEFLSFSDGTIVSNSTRVPTTPTNSQNAMKHSTPEKNDCNGNNHHHDDDSVTNGDDDNDGDGPIITSPSKSTLGEVAASRPAPLDSSGGNASTTTDPLRNAAIVVDSIRTVDETKYIPLVTNFQKCISSMKSDVTSRLDVLLESIICHMEQQNVVRLDEECKCVVQEADLLSFSSHTHSNDIINDNMLFVSNDDDDAQMQKDDAAMTLL